MLDINLLSTKYKVRLVEDSDVESVYNLCKENPLFYHHCPPFVTPDSIRADMSALPDGKTEEDKFYLGLFEGESLVAVLDLILRFPNEYTAFIGFFMMNKEYQGKGLGSVIIEEVCSCLNDTGFSHVRLGFAKGNPQSEHFWVKNGFERTGVEVQNEGYVVVVMEKRLGGELA